MTKKIVQLAKANNVFTSVWTVDSKCLAKHYKKIGVDYITSNKDLSL
jgi:glycerophosphoryl diester phosphodiesterase